MVERRTHGRLEVLVSLPFRVLDAEKKPSIANSFPPSRPLSPFPPSLPPSLLPSHPTCTAPARSCTSKASVFFSVAARGTTTRARAVRGCAFIAWQSERAWLAGGREREGGRDGRREGGREGKEGKEGRWCKINNILLR